MEVRPGDRVTIHGLASKPELNGTSGVLVGAAANGRVTVRLDSGAEIALKQQNLGVSAPGGGGGAPPGGGGMPGFGGGMPGFGGGGMPGMPGGFQMPAGMPNLEAISAQFRAAVERQLSALGVALPPGMTAGKVAAGLGLAAAGPLWILNRAFPFVVLLGVGLLAYAGKMTPRGAQVLDGVARKVSRLVGRPLKPTHLLIAVCIVAALMGRAIYPSGSPSAAAEGPAADEGYGAALKEAYKQGYDDALAGLDPRPPRHIPVHDAGRSAPAPSGSGFGMGSLLKYGMVASYLYKAGASPGGGFSPQMLMANLQANPMQAGMMLMMLSGAIF